MSRHIIGSEEDIEHLFYSCEVDIKNEYWTDMLRGGINPSDQYILVFLEGIMQRVLSWVTRRDSLELPLRMS